MPQVMARKWYIDDTFVGRILRLRHDELTSYDLHRYGRGKNRSGNGMIPSIPGKMCGTTLALIYRILLLSIGHIKKRPLP